MKRLSTCIRAAIVLAATASLAMPAIAQDFPAKAINIIAPFAGASENYARIVADALTKKLGQPVVVELRGGATGSIAARAVATAPADGYTLLMVTSSLSSNQTLSPTPYDLRSDFAFIAFVGAAKWALVVPADSPANSMQELADLAKANPDSYTFGSSGVGGHSHLVAELFKHSAEFSMLHVPYQSSPLAYPDVITGRIQLLFSPLTSAVPLIKDGQLRALAQSGSERSQDLPDVPTMAEAGFPEVGVESWTGLMAPAGTPPEVLAKLRQSVAEVLDQDDVKEAFAKFNQPVDGTMTPERWNTFIAEDVERWANIIDIGNIQPPQQ